MDLGIRKAFILAGGKGERLKPLTDHTPKVLLEIADKPILQWNIELAKKFGAQEVVLGVGYMHEKIRDFFGNGNRLGVKVSYSIEKTFMGTAGALKEAERFFEEEKKFIMMNGDEVKNVDFEALNQLFEKQKADAVISLTRVPDVSQFGSVQLNGEQITAFIEKSALPQNEKGLVNAGAYLVSHRALERIPKNQAVSIEKQVFPILAQQGSLFGLENRGQWFPTDTMKRIEKAQKEWKTRF